MRCKCKKRDRKSDRVTVQEVTTARDAVGDPVDSWAADGAPRFAKVVPLSGREFQLANQSTGEVSHRVEMVRSSANSITRQNRLLWVDAFGDSHTLNVEAVITPIDGNPREMDVMCKEEL